MLVAPVLEDATQSTFVQDDATGVASVLEDTTKAAFVPEDAIKTTTCLQEVTQAAEGLTDMMQRGLGILGNLKAAPHQPQPKATVVLGDSYPAVGSHTDHRGPLGPNTQGTENSGSHTSRTPFGEVCLVYI